MTHQPPICCVRWAARLLSLVLFGIVATIFIGEGGVDLFRLTVPEGALMALLVAVLAGLVIAWRYEVLGGTLVVGGVVLFGALQWCLAGRPPKTWFFAVFAVPGLLFLLTAGLSRSCPTRTMTGAPQ